VLVRVGGPERFRRDRPEHGLDSVPQAILHGTSRDGTGSRIVPSRPRSPPGIDRSWTERER
jgi:hypothetical protein